LDANAEFTADGDATAAANENAKQNHNSDDEGASAAVAHADAGAGAGSIRYPAPATAPTTPAEAFSTWIAGAPADTPRLRAVDARFTDPMAEQFAALTGESRRQSDGPSEKSLTLEAEYWDIKAKALQKKADAHAAYAKAASESGEQSPSETLAAEAEVELMLAEVKLCELNALRVKEAIEAADAAKLKMGDKGGRVELLQQALNALLKPSPKLDADGDFGPMTQQAVIQFQKAHGLKGDGVVDATTSEALGASLGLATPTDKFDRPRSITDKQQALMRSGVLHAEAHAKQAAKAAIAAGAKAVRSTTDSGGDVASDLHKRRIKAQMDALQLRLKATLSAMGDLEKQIDQADDLEEKDRQ
jgi:peptidoglycan hydrolase-like protein with peptidoglycan-binding domain